jgi:cardiolipin synthase
MTTVRLLKNGVEAFPAMFEAMDRAGTCIALEMYIYADDKTGREFRSHLVNAARRGVQVMVLVDAWGSWSLSDSFWGELRGAGGMVRRFRPMSRGMFLFRNHRKLLLVDDRIAYIGGLNIADEYYRGLGGEPSWPASGAPSRACGHGQICRFAGWPLPCAAAAMEKSPPAGGYASSKADPKTPCTPCAGSTGK